MMYLVDGLLKQTIKRANEPMSFYKGFEKKAFLGTLAGKALKGLGSAALKGVTTPVKAVGGLGAKALGLGTTEGKINALLTGASSLGDYGSYAEKFREASR